MESNYAAPLPADIRTPPHSLEAERSVLGALLQDYSAVVQAMEILAAEDFYQPEHAVLFSAMHSLYTQARAIDAVTLNDELARSGKLEGVGGALYLADLLSFVPTTAHFPHYAQIVLEKSTLRKMIAASNDIARNCYEQQLTVEQVLLHAEKSVFDIVMKRSGGEQLKHISEVMKTAYAKMEELDRNRGQIMGVPTGFTYLDRVLTGLHAGELILIGARPSMGKTSFAINIAAHAALKGKAVAVFSLEMPSDQIAMRIMCCDARVDLQRVRSGSLHAEDWDRFAQAIPPLTSTKLYIDDTASLTPSQLRSRCRRLMMEKGLDLAVVDYLQLMSADGRTENRQLEVSEISRKLKAIALELRIPVVACAQLSRANVQRAIKKPMLSDLRDSGSIEQDADVVMFLHRESYYDETSEETNSAEVIIAKQRNGPLDTIKLNWLSEYTLFVDAYEQEG